MLLFVLKRLAIGIALIWVVLTIIFLAIHTVPGDPAYQLAGGDSGFTEEGIERIREQLGLNKPVLEQYWIYLTDVITGNLGESFATRRSVAASIALRLPVTLELIAIAATVSVAIGIPIGSRAARRGGVFDNVSAASTAIALAVPVYVIGAVSVLLFAVTLHWLPAGGLPGWDEPVAHIRALVLPVLTLAIGFSAIVARITRGSVKETVSRDWVRTATALGMSPRTVFRRHVLRNSLIPVVTVIGLEVGTFLGSSVIVERVFNLPGLSSLLIDGVTARDYPVVQGVVIVIAVFFVVINVIVDIIYAFLDPRVRIS